MTTADPNLASTACVTWSASYSVVVIPALYNYYLNSGDLGFVRDHWQVPAGTSGGLMIADSSAHAWSTGPTAALSDFVLGVSPARPGYGHWIIAPQRGGLKWAQGVVPTPHGSISVRWRRTGARRVHLGRSSSTRELGHSCSAAACRRGTIARNGRVLWIGGRAAHGIRAHREGCTVVFAQTARSTTYASVA